MESFIRHFSRVETAAEAAEGARWVLDWLEQLSSSTYPLDHEQVAAVGMAVRGQRALVIWLNKESKRSARRRRAGGRKQ